MSKSIVSIVKGTIANKMVEEALNHLGGIQSLIKEGSTVVIKPNGGHVGPPESSVCTSPAVVKAVIETLRKANPKKIILAESAAIGCDTMECLETSGILKAAEEAGVDDIRDIKSDTDLIRNKIENPRSALRNVKLPRFLVEADHIVNVPIFKTHVSMVFTCALKNIKGVVQDSIHGTMHMTDLAAAMIFGRLSRLTFRLLISLGQWRDLDHIQQEILWISAVLLPARTRLLSMPPFVG